MTGTEQQVTAAAVTWLRDFATRQPYRSPGAALLEAARRLEAGEHLDGEAGPSD